MSLTLVGAPFIAAQSSQSHHPLIEILSMEMAPSIPFVGSFMDDIAANQESYPVMFTHSSGRLSLVFADYIGTAWAINYAYTDTARTAWSAYDRHTITALAHLEGLGACELSDGTIGIVYVEHTGATRVLKYMILPETGGAALHAASIATEGNVYTSGPCVIKLADDSYFMSYILYDTGTTHYHLYTRTSADFETWGAATEVTFDSLSTVVLDTDKKGNPALLQDSTGAIWLSFDNVDAIGPNSEELTNIYYTMTEDAGISWGTASQKTLVVANASQTQSADAVVFVGNLVLAIGGTTQGQILQGIAVTVGINSVPITLVDSTQAQAISTVVITGGRIVEVSNSAQASSIGTAALSNTTPLIVQNSTQSQTIGDTIPANIIKWSNYTEYGEVGKHPFLLETTFGHHTMIFDEISASMYMDETVPGWTGESAYPYSGVKQLHYDTATSKLYIATTNAIDPAVNEIDVPTWTVTDGWDALDAYGPPATTPAFSDIIGFSGYWHSEGKYIVTGGAGTVAGTGEVTLLDSEADTITEYRFSVINGKSQNVSWTPSTGITADQITSGWLDLASNRIYVYFQNSYIYTNALQIGYIDITAVGPTYTFTTLISDSHIDSDDFVAEELFIGGPQLMVYPTGDIILINYPSADSMINHWPGALRIYTLAGALWKMYIENSTSGTDYSAFPLAGFHAVYYHGGKIYGGVMYSDAVGETSKRGLCIIDILTDTITYSRPSSPSVDEYGLCDFCATPTSKFIIASYLYGIYPILSHSTGPCTTTPQFPDSLLEYLSR
jgi:hypothetical protein